MSIDEYEQHLRRLGFPVGPAGWTQFNGEDRLVYRVKKNGKSYQFYLRPADKMTPQQRADDIEAITAQLAD